MVYDPNMTTVACPAAGDAVATSNFAGGRFTVYAKTAGVIAVEQAPIDPASDDCVPLDEWTPVQITDSCGDGSKSDLVLEVLAEDVADGGVCSFTIDCTDDFVRFDADVFIVAQAKVSYRQAIQTGCAPLVI